MTEEFKKQIETEARQAVTELLAQAKLKKGDVFVVGCSSSEIVGGHIGKDSSVEAAQAVYAGIAPVLAARARAGRCFVLVTMAAGLTVARIREMAGADYPVIRIMPNTPCAIGKGMILCAAHGVTEAEKTAFCEGMAAAGRLDWLEEHLIDAGSAVSGCGPAFAYLFMEALADGAVECGLPRAKALEYAAQTLAGAAGLVLESGQHPGALKDAVCSPGGSTIAGVHALEDGAFRATAIHAVVAAYEKTRALGKG